MFKKLRYFIFGLKCYAAIHPHWGIWLPSVRATEEGSKKTFKDWNGHESSGWVCRKISVRINPL